MWDLGMLARAHRVVRPHLHSVVLSDLRKSLPNCRHPHSRSSRWNYTPNAGTTITRHVWRGLCQCPNSEKDRASVSRRGPSPKTPRGQEKIVSFSSMIGYATVAGHIKQLLQVILPVEFSERLKPAVKLILFGYMYSS
jgi:hypothetical protein